MQEVAFTAAMATALNSTGTRGGRGDRSHTRGAGKGTRLGNPEPRVLCESERFWLLGLAAVANLTPILLHKFKLLPPE